MKTEFLLYPVTFEKWLALPNCFQNFTGEIFPFEKQAKMGFVESGIIEQRQEHVCGGMMQEHGKLIAGGYGRTFAVLVVVRIHITCHFYCLAFGGQNVRLLLLAKPAEDQSSLLRRPAVAGDQHQCRRISIYQPFPQSSPEETAYFQYQRASRGFS